MWNFPLLRLGQNLTPGLSAATFRLMGGNIGEGTTFAPNVAFDFVFPEKITFGENCTVGWGATILAHEADQDEFRVGETVMGDNVLIGANCTVLPGVRIGDGATVSAHSLVNRDVEPGEFVGGVPIETLDASNSEKTESE